MRIEKTITINLSNPNNASVVVVGCDGQDLYKGLCVLLAHIKPQLKAPEMLNVMVEQALEDIECMKKTL